LRAVVQRVSSARVLAEGESVVAIGSGLCVLLGIAEDDEEDLAVRLAGKVARLRVFENADGKFDRSLLESFSTELDGREVLVHLGQIVPASHKLVKEHKHLFDPVEPRSDIEEVKTKSSKRRAVKK